MDNLLAQVTCVSDYLSFIEQLPSSSSPAADFDDTFVSSVTFFRGQANEAWGLTPSLFRQGLFDDESLLLQSIMHCRPDDFEGLDRFYAMALLQHYGMPTRLLDLTTNPLVALFFACSGEMKSNGKVIILPHFPTSWSTDPLIQLVMDFCFDYHRSQVDLASMLADSMDKYGHSVGRLMPTTIDLLIHYLTIPALGVRPKWTNPRLMAQQGAFLICGMELADRKKPASGNALGRYDCRFAPMMDTPISMIWKSACSCIVPYDCKEKILNELHLLGVDSMTLFPDLPHAIETVVNTVKRKSITKQGHGRLS